MRHWVIIFLSGLIVLSAVWAVEIEKAKAPVLPIVEQGENPGSTTASGGEVLSTTPPERGSAASGILPYNSGIQGKVLLGPTCPVEKSPPDPNCADKPYVTTITVYRTGATEVYAMRDSTEVGEFEFSMPPGSYTIVASDDKTLPTCSSTEVIVEPDAYADVLISCDSGIR